MPFLGPAIAGWITFSVLVMAAYFVLIAPKIGREDPVAPMGEMPPPELGRTGWATRWPETDQPAWSPPALSGVEVPERSALPPAAVEVPERTALPPPISVADVPTWVPPPISVAEVPTALPPPTSVAEVPTALPPPTSVAEVTTPVPRPRPGIRLRFVVRDIPGLPAEVRSQCIDRPVDALVPVPASPDV